MYSAFLCSLNTYQAWFAGTTRICASSRCMQSAFKIREYLVLKVHAVVDVHKPFVLSGSLYGGELNPSRLPKNPWYGVRFTIKTPILYLQCKAFRKQAWKMASTKRCKKTQGTNSSPCSLNCSQEKCADLLRFYVSRLSENYYFLLYICHVTLLILFYFVLVLSDTVLFYFILQIKAMKTKNWHSMNLQFI